MKPIEENLHHLDSKMRTESILLDERSYPLNRSATKYISVGLSPALNFASIVKIWGSGCCVFFTRQEWYEFTTLDHFTLSNGISKSSGDHQIRKTEYKDVKVLEIKCRDFKIMLSDISFKNLLSLTALIDSRLEMLNSLKFHEHYVNILKNLVT